MPVYCGAFALSIFLSMLFCRNRRSSSNNLLLWLPVLPILLVSVFRYGIGTDYLWVYDYGYQSVLHGRSWNYSRFEPGYLAINFLVGFFHGSSFWVFAIMALIFHYFMYKFILEWTNNVAFSLLLLLLSQVWLFSLSGIRQAAALAIVAFAIRFAASREPARYFVLISLAASLHFTALVYFPLYFLFRRKYSQVTVLFLSVILFALGFVAPSFLKTVANVFGRGDYFASSYFKNRIYYVEFFVTLLVASITLFLQCKSPDFDSRYRVLINAAIFALFSASCSAAIPNAERFDLYFTVAYIVLIPILCMYCKTQLLSLGLAVFLSLILGSRLVYDTYFSGDSNGVAEYRCILIEDGGRHL